MKSRLACAILLFIIPLFAGCGQPSGKTKDTIGVSVMTLANPFFKTIGDTITEEAAKHGYKVVVVDGANDVVKQKDQVKDFIIKKVAAIVLCPCNSKSIGAAIKDANKAGIPVFTADLACTASDAKVVAHVATDNYEGGKLAGVAMIEALGSSGGKVVILHHKPAESCRERVRGFREILDAHNKKQHSPKIQIMSELDGAGQRDVGFKAAQDALQTHADLAGIFAINDPSALGAHAALEQAKRTKDVKIIGFDGQKIGKQGIKDGKIYADPIQFPKVIARKTVAAIIQHFNGEEVPAVQLIPTKLYRQKDALNDPELK